MRNVAIITIFLIIGATLGAVIYSSTWIVPFTPSTTKPAGAVLNVNDVRFYSVSSTDYVEVIIRNSGTGDVKVDSLYAGTTDSNLATQTGVSYNPSTQIITAGSTLNMTITYDWTDGTRYYFKMFTEEGFEIPFTKEA